MVINQRILRVGAIVAVAGATGLVMQVQAPEALTIGHEVTPLAAPQAAAPVSQTAPVATAQIDASGAAAVNSDISATSADVPLQIAALSPATDTPDTAQQVSTETTVAPPQSVSGTTEDACSADMALVVQPGAMLDLGVISPCRPHQRVVIRHAGLAITGMTSAAGTLIASIPALQSPAEVTLSFLDGTEAVETAEVADLNSYDRFVIQWHEADAFQLRAYPAGFEAGEADVIAAASPGKVSESGSYLMALGAADAPRPLLAEVFTWPVGERATESAVKLAIEAAVTEQTCAREILGETLQLSKGALTRRDFSIEMPDCGAIGEYVALPNPVSPEKLAAN